MKDPNNINFYINIPINAKYIRVCSNGTSTELYFCNIYENNIINEIDTKIKIIEPITNDLKNAIYTIPDNKIAYEINYNFHSTGNGKYFRRTPIYNIDPSITKIYINNTTITDENPIAVVVYWYTDTEYISYNTLLSSSEECNIIDNATRLEFYFRYSNEMALSEYPDIDYIYNNITISSNADIHKQNKILNLEEEIININNQISKISTKSTRYLHSCFLFDYNFLKDETFNNLSDNFNENDITSNGYELLYGFENKIQINKNIDCDEISIRVDITLLDTNSVILLGSMPTNNTTNASQLTFDFANKIIKFAPQSNGQSYNTSSKVQVNMPEPNGSRYLLEIGRDERCLRGSLLNYKTGEYTEILVDENELSEYIRPAGWLYDYFIFSTISGSVAYRRITCAVPSNPYFCFIGDSITEGYGVPHDKKWAYLACKELGVDSVILGRSGSTISHVIAQVDDIVSIMKPKYVVVTIGTNGGNTTALLNSLVSKIKNIGCVPIINRVSMKNDKTQTSNINIMISDLNELSAPMDYATAINHDPSQGIDLSLFQSDKLHPNIAGNEIMAQYFINTFKWLLL